MSNQTSENRTYFRPVLQTRTSGFRTVTVNGKRCTLRPITHFSERPKTELSIWKTEQNLVRLSAVLISGRSIVRFFTLVKRTNRTLWGSPTERLRSGSRRRSKSNLTTEPFRKRPKSDVHCNGILQWLSEYQTTKIKTTPKSELKGIWMVALEVNYVPVN